MHCGHPLRATFTRRGALRRQLALLAHHLWILPSSEVSDDTAKRCLNSFINEVTHKRDSPLICEPPKHPPAKPVVPQWSRRLAAQPISRVPASKRGEVLIMQRMSFIKDPSAPSTSRLEAYDKLFGGDLTADDAKALDELFSVVSSFGCSFYVIST